MKEKIKEILQSVINNIPFILAYLILHIPLLIFMPLYNDFMTVLNIIFYELWLITLLVVIFSARINAEKKCMKEIYRLETKIENLRIGKKED